MSSKNYNDAREYLLKQDRIIDFINEFVALLQKECVDKTDFRPFAKKYIDKLSTLNLSRLESIIIIVEIRDILEDENGYACTCIDSFIDDIYTRHTGDYNLHGLLRFKNEPEDLCRLSDYIHSDDWRSDTSWMSERY